MSQSEREIVIPSQFLGDANQFKSGKGTFIENGKIYAQIMGILQRNNQYLNVIPLKGKYDAFTGDTVIGIVLEALGSSWLVDINAPYPALLHVNEVPWNVEFNETDKYLNAKDTILAKVLSVDTEKKLQVTMKDRNLYKIKKGTIVEIDSSKIPRVIGKKGSMISLLKKYTNCRIIVGKNGRIWTVLIRFCKLAESKNSRSTASGACPSSCTLSPYVMRTTSRWSQEALC